MGYNQTNMIKFTYTSQILLFQILKTNSGALRQLGLGQKSFFSYLDQIPDIPVCKLPKLNIKPNFSQILEFYIRKFFQKILLYAFQLVLRIMQRLEVIFLGNPF